MIARKNMTKRFGFSNKPYREKQRQKQLLLEIKKRYEEGERQHKRWIKSRNFDPEPLLKSWESSKKPQEKDLTELVISALSTSDALVSANEMVVNGLRLNQAAIEVEGLSDLAYNIYMMRAAELLCSKKFAGLSSDTTKLFMQALVAQMMPPPASRIQERELDLLTKILKVKERR